MRTIKTSNTAVTNSHNETVSVRLEKGTKTVSLWLEEDGVPFVVEMHVDYLQTIGLAINLFNNVGLDADMKEAA